MCSKAQYPEGRAEGVSKGEPREGFERRGRSNPLFQVLDLYWNSPESDDLWHKSKQFKTAIYPPMQYREGNAEGVSKGEPREGFERPSAPARPEVHLKLSIFRYRFLPCLRCVKP